MTVQELLYETTYDVEAINIITDRVLKQIEGKSKSFFDISKTLHDLKLMPKSYIMKVQYFTKKARVASGVGGYVKRNNKFIVDTKKFVPEITIIIIEDEENSMRKTFQHELIHALDYVKNAKHHKGTVRNLSRKKNYDNTWLTYKKDPVEFNQVIHFVKIYRDKSYDKLTTLNDVMKWALVKSEPHKVPSFARTKWYKDILNHMLKDTSFREMFGKRLYREGLLPRAMMNSPTAKPS